MLAASKCPTHTATRHNASESHRVCAGLEPLAVSRKGERLEAEGGKRGIAAAEADHHELAR